MPPKNPRRASCVASNTKYLRTTKLGWTQTRLAKYLGVHQSSVVVYESGESFPREDILVKLAALAGCSPAAFHYTDISNPTRPRIAIEGYIGPGEVVTLAATAVETAEIPLHLDAAGLRALKTQPGILGPPFRGEWYVFYRRAPDAAVPAECLGHPCVTKIRGDGLLLKEVRRGYTPGRYNLYSIYGHPTLEDQQLDWAGRVYSYVRSD